MVKSRAWSPYLSGLVIGLLAVPALVITDTLMEPGGGFLTVAGHLLALFGADPHQPNSIGAHFDGPRNWWQVALLIGIVLGAVLTSTLSNSRRCGPASRFSAVFSCCSARRWPMAIWSGMAFRGWRNCRWGRWISWWRWRWAGLPAVCCCAGPEVNRERTHSRCRC